VPRSSPGARLIDDYREFFATRRSIRELRTDPVDEDTVWRMLDIANTAPSAHNAQPWRFALVEPGQRRAALAERLSKRLREHLATLGTPAAEVARQTDRTRRRLTDAPVAIFVCLDESAIQATAQPASAGAERTLAIQGTALAAGWLLLAAHAEGLGACWYSTPLFVPDEVRDTLALPPAWNPQALVLLGYAAGAGTARARKDVRELTLRLS